MPQWALKRLFLFDGNFITDMIGVAYMREESKGGEENLFPFGVGGGHIMFPWGREEDVQQA